MGETAGDIQIHPLTSDRWPDLLRLFGPEGADGGCWCMYWRFSEREYGDNDDFSVWRALTRAQKKNNRDAL